MRKYTSELITTLNNKAIVKLNYRGATCDIKNYALCSSSTSVIVESYNLAELYRRARGEM